jgi:serine protease Do
MRRLIKILVILIVFLGLWSALFNYFPQINSYFENLNPNAERLDLGTEKVKIVTEESVTINAVKKIGPSVVTIEEEANQTSQSEPLQFGPFSIFGLQQQQNTAPQNIGSGFIVSKEGLVVTSKHVVSDATVKYAVITNNDKKYKVKSIYKDPLNDIAVLKIEPSENSGNKLVEVELGDSSRLQVGQFVVAMGTALGEFKNTVTTGVISGLGRGITAGDQFAGFVEKLDDVIQTDAAINPGNSGGPLINSSGQVIGINTAVAQNGQNIGFALPINILKASLKTFNESGQFNRAYLGVSYKMVTKDIALLNDIVQGAYVQNVVKNSPADKAGIQAGDVIIKFDGRKINAEKDELSTLISQKKASDTITIGVWRNGKTQDLTVKLGSTENQ